MNHCVLGPVEVQGRPSGPTTGEKEKSWQDSSGEGEQEGELDRKKCRVPKKKASGWENSRRKRQRFVLSERERASDQRGIAGGGTRKTDIGAVASSAVAILQGK